MENGAPGAAIIEAARIVTLATEAGAGLVQYTA